MASRLARNALGASRGLRPTVSSSVPRAAAGILPVVTSRQSSNVPAEEPKAKAQSIIDALPGNSMISKTAIMSSASALTIYALSNEYYVMNEETVIAFCLLTVWGSLIKYGGPLYKEWAEGHAARIKGILDAAKARHRASVEERIDSAKEMSSVVDVTKTLFEVSKETAQLEAKAYELQQTTAMAAEAKAVLDSWVRYEGQVKARQQKELSDDVINKVKKELENPRNLSQILQQSVSEVERILASKSQ